MTIDPLFQPTRPIDAHSRSPDRGVRATRSRRGGHEGRTVRAVDRALEMLERSRLSATELRILLAARAGEVSLPAAARAFGRRPAELRRSAARLYARGLIRWRDDAETKEPVFGVTHAGRDMLRSVVSTGAT